MRLATSAPVRQLHPAAAAHKHAVPSGALTKATTGQGHAAIRRRAIMTSGRNRGLTCAHPTGCASPKEHAR
ncbi:hypothetical protein [Actinokineospora globicatena]|uniref:hypothetical protein n=1 Tax=Actinokineospora globicatena TaxID=103729 RepID=UPI002552628A|nr:hypothetical protein [Actinokineospora globicatena]